MRRSSPEWKLAEIKRNERRYSKETDEDEARLRLCASFPLFSLLGVLFGDFPPFPRVIGLLNDY